MIILILYYQFIKLFLYRKCLFLRNMVPLNLSCNLPPLGYFKASNWPAQLRKETR